MSTEPPIAFWAEQPRGKDPVRVDHPRPCQMVDIAVVSDTTDAMASALEMSNFGMGLRNTS